MDSGRLTYQYPQQIEHILDTPFITILWQNTVELYFSLNLYGADCIYFIMNLILADI